MDIPALSAAYVAAFKEVDPSEVWTEDRAGDLVRFFMKAQPDLVFVAEQDNEVVGGICGLAKPWWDGTHLVETELFLHPTAQRQGIGANLLLQYLQEAARLYRVTKMEAITFKGLDFPSSWYLQIGLEEKGDWKIVVGDVEVMTQRLRSRVERATTNL
jgi:GNAT superfamily N-acetyltransferase